jgi:DNA-directed RNA polymerase III subunit RPC1
LTVKLAEIIQINNLIKISIEEGLPTNKLIEDWNLMQYTIAQYFNSEAPGLPLNLLGTKQIRGMSQRLKGKHGRFRQNLSGKRVDFTGRTVISPDPNCAIDEVMVPQHMAMILTYPERVNLYNLERLRGLVRTGPGVHPGANYVEYGGTNGEKSFL